jgi:hypothetical protein
LPKATAEEIRASWRTAAMKANVPVAPDVTTPKPVEATTAADKAKASWRAVQAEIEKLRGW